MKITSKCKHFSKALLIYETSDQRYLHHMNESFDIPVTYNGEELFFHARLRHLGYTHLFIVDVNGREFFFEPDEEQNYRAVMDSEIRTSHSKVDMELLKAIAAAIKTILS